MLLFDLSTEKRARLALLSGGLSLIAVVALL